MALHATEDDADELLAAVLGSLGGKGCPGIALGETRKNGTDEVRSATTWLDVSFNIFRADKHMQP